MLDRMRRRETVPRKHHIALRDAEGRLRYEECLTRGGLRRAVHHRLPPAPAARAAAWREPGTAAVPAPAPARPLAKRHYRTQDLAPRAAARRSTRACRSSSTRDVVAGLVTPDAPDPVYFSNGDGDDLYFILQGGGLLRSPLGDLRFEQDDYVFVPKGLLHRLRARHRPAALALARVPGRAPASRSSGGTRRGSSGWTRPTASATSGCAEFQGPHGRGDPRAGREARTAPSTASATRPRRSTWWAGTARSTRVAFPILNFQPRAGLVHLPPTWHGTFAARGALVCSFVPRRGRLPPRGDPLPVPARVGRRGRDPVLRPRRVHVSRRGVGPGSHLAPPGGRDARPAPRRVRGIIGARTTERAGGDARLLPAALSRPPPRSASRTPGTRRASSDWSRSP